MTDSVRTDERTVGAAGARQHAPADVAPELYDPATGTEPTAEDDADSRSNGPVATQFPTETDR